MKRSETCIITNMCMVYDEAGNILVQDRTSLSWPGICFPGGHVEAGESFVESTIREVKEETGLDVWNLRICGLKQFTQNDYRYIVMYFKTNCFKGELTSTSEGNVFWIKKDDLHRYKLCEGFPEMVKVFFEEELNETFYELTGDEWSIRNL